MSNLYLVRTTRAGKTYTRLVMAENRDAACARAAYRWGGISPDECRATVFDGDTHADTPPRPATPEPH